MRKEILENIYSRKKGVSLLLRDSLPVPASDSEPTSDSLPRTEAEEPEHVCVTDHRAKCRERVGERIFEYSASSFFQNNNSILLPLTEYVRNAIFPPPQADQSSSWTKPTHLVDTYCGAGLFALTLSSHFEVIRGVEQSSDSIASANKNIVLNTPLDPTLPSKCTFSSGNAESIFSSVQDFPRAETAVIIDPPRKGCDEAFIKQLLEFGAGTVVYVSCNVHTQARDVGDIVRGSRREGKEGYRLESLRGFDLFPQTAHVESVAVLRMADA
jgi:tRNA (uracil-5-)-methyltransferase